MLIPPHRAAQARFLGHASLAVVVTAASFVAASTASTASAAPGVSDTPAAGAPARPGGAPSGERFQPAPRNAGPHIVGERTVPTYDFAQAVRQSIRISTDLDTDKDGTKDVINLDIVRPREAEAQGVKVPVILGFTPYSRLKMAGDLPTYDAKGNIEHFPFLVDNYFVPRGYAVASADVLGTGRSTGCPNVGGPDEVAGIRAVVEYLTGTRPGKTVEGQDAPVGWTTGNIGTIGKSYVGTTAVQAAALGIPQVRTALTNAGLNSWYHYTHPGGLGTPGRRGYMTMFARNNASHPQGCSAAFDALEKEADEGGGSTSPFWEVRDLLKQTSKITGSVMVVQGLHDDNVTPREAGTWWNELTRLGVPRRAWFHQGKHDRPEEFRTQPWSDITTAWFDHWLQGLDTGVMKRPAVDVETTLGTWQSFADWPSGPMTAVPFAGGGLSAPVTVSETTKDSERRVDGYAGLDAKPETALTATATVGAAPLRIAGTPRVVLRIKTSSDRLVLRAALVDKGTARRYASTEVTSEQACWGEKAPKDDNCVKARTFRGAETAREVIVRDGLSLRHRDTPDKPQAVPTDTWIDVSMPLAAVDATLAAGHTLGLVVAGDAQGSGGRGTFQVDLDRSRVELPVTTAAVPALTYRR